MENKPETTKILAQFVVDTGYKNIPREAIEFSKQLILHCLGGAVAGARHPASKIFIDHIRAQGGAAEAGVMGAGFKSSVVNAAFVGGFTPHAIEVEDGAWPGAASPITVFPVSFALAEKMGLTGRDILTSFVIGFEVQGKVAAAAPGGHARGLSLLAGMGTFGATAAAAKLMKMNVDQIMSAFGIAASQAAGLVDCSTGYMTHYFQSGASCRNGIISAMLAKKGFTGHHKCLEMKHGLLEIYCGENGFDLKQMTSNLGNPFHIIQTRVKKYPICTLNHRVIDGVLELVKKNDVKPEQVQSIEIGVNSILPRVLQYPEPKSPEEAQFSMPYVVTAAVMSRKVDLDELSQEKVSDPKRKEFMKKIKLTIHPEWDAEASKNPELAGTNPLTIKLKNGKELFRDCVYYKGGPEEPLTAEEMAEIYRPMARKVLPARAVKRIEELTMDLENVRDLTELNALLLGKAKN